MAVEAFAASVGQAVADLGEERVEDAARLPAYDAYLPGLYSRGPFGGGLSGRTLTVRVDRNRNVLDV
mgnify:CR=1 FL=1